MRSRTRSGRPAKIGVRAKNSRSTSEPPLPITRNSTPTASDSQISLMAALDRLGAPVICFEAANAAPPSSAPHAVLSEHLAKPPIYCGCSHWADADFEE